jgi:hypothetical protein
MEAVEVVEVGHLQAEEEPFLVVEGVVQAGHRKKAAVVEEPVEHLKESPKQATH